MGNKQKVGVIYRRISDEYLDPMTFEADSLIGIPNIMDVYRAGNVAIINAPGKRQGDKCRLRLEMSWRIQGAMRFVFSHASGTTENKSYISCVLLT